MESTVAKDFMLWLLLLLLLLRRPEGLEVAVVVVVVVLVAVDSSSNTMAGRRNGARATNGPVGRLARCLAATSSWR